MLMPACSVFDYVRQNNITTEKLYAYSAGKTGVTGVRLCVCVRSLLGRQCDGAASYDSPRARLGDLQG